MYPNPILIVYSHEPPLCSDMCSHLLSSNSAPAPSTFGQPSGGFGSAAQQPTFGSLADGSNMTSFGSLVGSPAQPTSALGQPQQPAANAFGSPSFGGNTSGFGSPAATPPG